MAASSGLSLDNPVFADFAFFSIILALKCLMMSVLTSYLRVTKLVFNRINKEDFAGFQTTPDKMKAVDEVHVERVRNAHHNDMENVYPFLTIGLIYVLSNPDPITAVWLFRIFTAVRIAHTVVYVNAIRQPFRAICFGVGLAINVAMCVLTLKNILGK